MKNKALRSNDVNYDTELCHEFCRKNQEAIHKGKRIGCFHCISTLVDKKLIPSQHENACCPSCGYDTLISDHDVPFTEDFLIQMNNYWFNSDRRRPK